MRKRERAQIDKIRNEKGELTTSITQIQRVIREYYEKLYVNKLDYLEEVNKFLETYNLSKLNQGEIENLSRHITSKEFDSVIIKKKPPKQQKSRARSFHR